MSSGVGTSNNGSPTFSMCDKCFISLLKATDDISEFCLADVSLCQNCQACLNYWLSAISKTNFLHRLPYLSTETLLSVKEAVIKRLASQQREEYVEHGLETNPDGQFKKEKDEVVGEGGAVDLHEEGLLEEKGEIGEPAEATTAPCPPSKAMDQTTTTTSPPTTPIPSCTPTPTDTPPATVSPTGLPLSTVPEEARTSQQVLEPSKPSRRILDLHSSQKENQPAQLPRTIRIALSNDEESVVRTDINNNLKLFSVRLRRLALDKNLSFKKKSDNEASREKDKAMQVESCTEPATPPTQSAPPSEAGQAEEQPAPPPQVPRPVRESRPSSQLAAGGSAGSPEEGKETQLDIAMPTAERPKGKGLGSLTPSALQAAGGAAFPPPAGGPGKKQGKEPARPVFLPGSVYGPVGSSVTAAPTFGMTHTHPAAAGLYPGHWPGQAAPPPAVTASQGQAALLNHIMRRPAAQLFTYSQVNPTVWWPRPSASSTAAAIQQEKVRRMNEASAQMRDFWACQRNQKAFPISYANYTQSKGERARSFNAVPAAEYRPIQPAPARKAVTMTGWRPCPPLTPIPETATTSSGTAKRPREDDDGVDGLDLVVDAEEMQIDRPELDLKAGRKTMSSCQRDLLNGYLRRSKAFKKPKTQ